MDITPYIDAFTRKKRAPSMLYEMSTARSLLKGSSDFALINQESYYDSEYLEYNIKASVRGYSRNKDIAIHIYKDFLEFLKEKSGWEISVKFPPIAISNTFERLMFIAKYLHDPKNKVSELSDHLWVSERTISEDIKKLSGYHEDPIQVCGKVFVIDDLERRGNNVSFSSTAHPIFLTQNLTQVLVMLKGLKIMCENPLYAEYASLAAADIWEQLSDYAKTRIRFVLSNLLPEDLSWYESLKKTEKMHFYSEVRCRGAGVLMDCIKNGKSFFIEYEDSENSICIYNRCTYVPGSYDGDSVEVNCENGRDRIFLKKVIKSAYTAEEMM